MRVLLAEDDRLLRETWANYLHQAHFDIDQAEGMRETLYRFSMQLPDAVILSLNLLSPDGIRLIALMEQFHARCPLVIIAADPEPYLPIIRPDKDVLLKKPVELPRVLEVLKAIRTRLKLGEPESGLDAPELPFVMSPRRGGRHYHKKHQRLQSAFSSTQNL